MKLAKFVIKINYPFALLGGWHVPLSEAVGANSEKGHFTANALVVGILFKTYCRHIQRHIYNVVVIKYLLVVFVGKHKGNQSNIVDVKCLTVTGNDAFIKQCSTTTKTL